MRGSFCIEEMTAATTVYFVSTASLKAHPTYPSGNLIIAYHGRLLGVPGKSHHDNRQHSHTLVDDCIQIMQVLGLREGDRIVNRRECRINFRFQSFERLGIVEKKKLRERSRRARSITPSNPVSRSARTPPLIQNTDMKSAISS